MADTFPLVHQGAAVPSGGPSFGAKSLLAHGIEHFDAYSLGIYNNRSVRGGVALSLHAEGRAIDFGYPYRVGGADAGWSLARWLLTHHRALGVQQLIYARKIWRNTRDAEGWRYYSGTAAHHEHVHVELTRDAAVELSPTMILERTGATDMGTLNIPEAAIESLLITKVKQTYELFPQRDPGIGGWRWYAGLAVQAFRAGKDPSVVLYDLELQLLAKLSQADRDQLAALVTDSDG